MYVLELFVSFLVTNTSFRAALAAADSPDYQRWPSVYHERLQDMRKLIACTSVLLLLLAGLIACRYALPAPTQVTPIGTAALPEIVPASTIPPDVSADDIRGPIPEAIEAIRQMAREHPGLSFGIKGTYAEQVPGTYDAFRVEDNTFIGQFGLWNARLEAHDFAITCLIDHMQMPCTPDEPMVQSMTLQADEEILLPLEIPGLARGLHDFSVTFWQDPYADHKDPEADSRVFDSNTYRARVSIFVDGDTAPPTPDYENPSGQPSHDSIDFTVSQELDPRDEYGGFPIVTHISASAGELFELYIHLNNRESVAIDYAVTAFINYQQTPIYRDGELHTPLYVQVPASTWQPVAVQVRAPDEPGHYEFFVVSTLFPFARLDVETEAYHGIESLINNAYSSARILIEVK